MNTRWARILAVAALMPTTAGAQSVTNIRGEDREIDPAPEDLYTVGSMLGDEWETFAGVRSVAFLGVDIYYHPSEGAVGVSSSFSMSSRGGRPEMPSGAPVRLVPFAEDAEIEELYSAWRRPLEIEGGSGGRMSFSSGGGGNIQVSGMPRQRAFEPTLAVGVLPDGRIALADSAAYQIKLLGPTGDLGEVLRRPIAPRAVTRRDQEDEKERRLDEIEGGSSGGGNFVMVRQGTGDAAAGGVGAGTHRIGGDAMAEMRKQMVENLDFAEEMPVIAGIAVDADGRIWIERTGRRVGEDGPTDVVTVSGDYLGTIPAEGVRIPMAFGPGGLMAYLERDELDVVSVVVKRIGEIR